MSYAFIQDVPADEEIYRKVLAQLGDEPPVGLIAHLVVRQPAGLRYIDVWESEGAWERFRDEQAEPAVERVLTDAGIPHDHSMVRFEPIEVIHTWLGGR